MVIGSEERGTALPLMIEFTHPAPMPVVNQWCPPKLPPSYRTAPS